MEINYQQDNNYDEFPFSKIQQQPVISSFVRLKGYHQSNHNKLNQFNLQRKRKNPLELKQLVLKAKVNILTKNFIRKMKRGRIYTKLPEQIHKIEDEQTYNFLDQLIKYLEKTQGLELSPIMLCIWSFINIIQISIMVVIFSIMIAFPETQQFEYFVIARFLSVSLYVIDMILNFITQRHEIGGLKKNLKDIAYFYLTNQFTPDFFSIFIFPLSYAFKASDITPIIMIIALFKLKNNLKKFESYQFIYVKTTTRQRYYGLLKVFLLNFSIGHVLSILLNLMADLSPINESWLGREGLENAEWHVKYIWGYYWGTNIMLTVGFGDISAANKTQATLLIFIQTLSCITLAYNISCVGSIIGQMKAENEEKKKKLKYFHRMCEDNKITEQLQQKINNFIEQSYLIKQQFELQEYEQVINSLPKSMQSEYRKQANKSLFEVGFFNSLNNKTILNLAEYVIRKVAHPQQIIQKKGQIEHFCILQKGCIGFTYKNGIKSDMNGTIIQKFQIGKGQIPQILSLGFVKRRILMFDVKSIFYSVFYYLSYDEFMKKLQTCEMDYHFFLYMKDRDDYILGSNEIYKCKVCVDDYHTLFECPRYHYMPIKEIVLLRSIKQQSFQKNKRRKCPEERQYRDYKSLHNKKLVENGQEIYLRQNFDENEIREIKNIKKYYYKKMAEYNETIQQIKTLEARSITNEVNPLELQINKIQDMLNKASNNNYMDFWLIESDSAFNFSYYFKEFNPNRLNNFKLFPPKKKQKQTGFGVPLYRSPSKIKMSKDKDKNLESFTFDINSNSFHEYDKIHFASQISKFSNRQQYQ